MSANDDRDESMEGGLPPIPDPTYSIVDAPHPGEDFDPSAHVVESAVLLHEHLTDRLRAGADPALVLKQMSDTASLHGDLLDVVKGMGRGRRKKRMGNWMEVGYGDDVGEGLPSGGLNAETFGATVIGELVTSFKGIAMTSQAPQMIRAIADARSKGMADLADELERQLRDAFGIPPKDEIEDEDDAERIVLDHDKGVMMGTGCVPSPDGGMLVPCNRIVMVGDDQDHHDYASLHEAVEREDPGAVLLVFEGATIGLDPLRLHEGPPARYEVVEAGGTKHAMPVPEIVVEPVGPTRVTLPAPSGRSYTVGERYCDFADIASALIGAEPGDILSVDQGDGGPLAFYQVIHDPARGNAVTPLTTQGRSDLMLVHTGKVDDDVVVEASGRTWKIPPGGSLTLHQCAICFRYVEELDLLSTCGAEACRKARRQRYWDQHAADDECDGCDDCDDGDADRLRPGEASGIIPPLVDKLLTGGKVDLDTFMEETYDEETRAGIEDELVEARRSVNRCTVCGVNAVDAEAGIDTCDDCRDKA